MLVGFVIAGIFAFMNRKKLVQFFKKNYRLFYIICFGLIVVSVVARLCFLFASDRFLIDLTLSDTGVQWYGAQQIVENGVFDQEIGDYESVYPYLSSYTVTLSLFMRLFGESQIAIVVSNLLFDLISCIAIYFLFLNWKKSKKKGLLAATLWAINPLEIAFCGLPLAIVLVNMFVILVITITYYCFRLKDKTFLFVLLAILLGLLLAFGNALRPIFVVFLIAILLYGFYNIIKDKKCLKSTILGMACMCVVYFGAGLLPNVVHAHINPYYEGEKSSAAWSIFVGANYESHGKWSSGDRDVFFGPVLRGQAEGDIEKAQSIILKSGLTRYKDMVVEHKVISHFINKTGVLFGDVKNSIYDLPYAYNFSNNNKFYKFLQDGILIYYYSILVVCLYCLCITIKRRELIKRQGTFGLFLVTLFIGLFFASLMVEVMNRYSLPFVAILFIIAMGLVFLEKKNSKDMIQ